MHNDTPTQIPGIELKSEIKIAGSTVIMVSVNSDQEMEAVAANARFRNIPATTTPSAVGNIIVIYDDLLDDDAVVAKECKVEPYDVSASGIANPEQSDNSMANNDTSNTLEGVNPT